MSTRESPASARSGRAVLVRARGGLRLPTRSRQLAKQRRLAPVQAPVSGAVSSFKVLRLSMEPVTPELAGLTGTSTAT